MIDSIRQIEVQLTTAETLDDDRKHIVGESKTVPQIRTMVSPFDGEMNRPNLQGQAFYQLSRLIRNDPTVRLVRELVMAPILRAGWSYESNDKAPEGALEAVKSLMDRMRIELLKSSMSSCMDFGYAPYEIIVDSAWNIKVKPLLVDYTTILVNAVTGEFFGLKQQPQYNLGNTYAYLTRNESFIVAQDVEAGNLYGRATNISLVEVFDETTGINRASRKYDKKVAGTHWVIYYPLGKTKFNGVEMDNGEIAKELLSRAEAVGGIMVPRSVLQAIDTMTAQAAANEATQWKIELLSDKGAGQMAFENKLKYLDVLKVRAFGVPERAILEGQYGTKAEAETHADIAIANLEVRHQSLVDIYNYELVNKYLKWHYGYEAINSVYIKPTPIDDLALSFTRQLYMQLLTDPNTAAQEQTHIDMAALRDSLSVPEVDHDENSGTADDWINEILGGDDSDVLTELGLSNFDPNEPRDEMGRWADEGGPSLPDEWTEAVGKEWEEKQAKAEEIFKDCTQENKDIAHSVLNYMNRECLDRFIANAKKVVEFANEDEITEFYLSGKGLANLGANWGANSKVQGSYASDGTLRLDGDSDKRGVYAHEFGHAIDYSERNAVTGYRKQVSKTYQWREAWDKEIKSTGNLSEYATTSQGEGFAEFARLVFSMPREARREFPQCYKVWKQNGLVDK